MAHDSVSGTDERRAGTPDIDSTKPLLNRRNYLRLGAAAAGTMALASGAASARSTRHGITFDRVVNAVEDLGWDPNGNREISIPNDDGLLIEVPPGEYVFEGSGSKAAPVDGTLKNWGIRGLGDHWSDVVIRTSNNESTRFISSRNDSNGILIENLTFDNGPSTRGGDIGLTLNARDNIEVHDVEVTGMSGAEPYCRWTIKPKVTSASGVANIVNFRKTGPSVFTGHGNSDGGGGCFPGNDGTTNFIDCRIENQGGDGGLYTGKHDGTCNFYNCYFANNDMGVIRMGAGSEIHDSTIVMDWDNAHPDNVVLDGEWDHEAPTGTSGIYSSSAEFGKSGGGFYNCDIIMKSTYRKGQAAISVNNSEGHMDIKGCRIQVDIPGMPGIWGRDPAHQRLSRHKTPSKPWGLTIENCSITGSSDEPAILLDHRHGSVIRNCCIQMQGSGPGICLENSSDCTIEDTNVNTSGRATVFNNCTARTSNITSSDSCPRPDPSWSGSGGDTSDGTTDTGGSDGTDGQSGEERVLSIVGDGTLSEYEFAVDGDLRENPNEGALGGPDQISGSTATGAVGGGTDSYLFTGQVTEFALDGSATVLLDGTAVAPADLPTLTAPEDSTDDGSTDGGSADDGSTDDGSSSGGTATEYTLAVDGDGTLSRYEFTVDGEVRENADVGPLGGPDQISGSTATGAVERGTDGYTIVGQVTEFALDGSATVLLDGTAVAPADLPTLTAPDDSTDDGSTDDGSSNGGSTDDGSNDGSSDDPATPEDPTTEHVLEIVGTGERVSYDFTVSGDLNHDPSRGTVDSQDSISGATATGIVLSGTDSYLFTGGVSAFSMTGNADVYLDGEQVDPLALAPANTLTIVSGSATASAYRFTVSGGLSPDAENGSLEEADNISGPSAEGAVSNDTDSYRFSGDVVDFDLRGDAAVYLNGEQVSPDRLGTEEDPALPNLIVVDGTGSSGRCDYRFTVTGDVRKSFELGSIEADDTIEGGTVVGSVEGERDAYRFTGDIVSFDMDGTAAIRFEETAN